MKPPSINAFAAMFLLVLTPFLFAQTGKHRMVGVASSGGTFVSFCSQQSGSTTVSSTSCTLTLNPNRLLIIYTDTISGLTATPSDGDLLTWNPILATTFWGSSEIWGWWALTGSNSGNDTVTVSFSGGGSAFVDLYVGLYAGTSLSSPFDVNAFNSGGSVAAGGTISTGNFTTAQNGELIVMYCASLNNVGSQSAIDAPYTQRFGVVSPDTMSIGDGTATTAGTNTATCTVTNSTSAYVITASAFK